ncbi:MAG TPA: hypothetical protein VM619_11110 [Luteimonas sp.]|jgi:hypothetical protein|nr:hypothetical protein [Luteimonas sp.]
MSNGINVSVYVGDIASSGLQREKDGVAGSGGKSWLVAIAQAMGNALGTKAAKLVELSKKLDSLAGSSSDDQQAAKEFQKTMAQFQAESQLFSMMSNAFSTAVKSIGEGMTSLARKQ